MVETAHLSLGSATIGEELSLQISSLLTTIPPLV